MKKAILILGIIASLVLLAVLVSCGQNLQPQVDKLTEENKMLREIAGPPPASLDNLFPPKAPAPVYLLEMFGLSGPFEGIGIDLQEGDIAGAKANFDAFQKQYIKMSDMVPEWKDKFPMTPVDTLGQALASGDPAKVGPAMGQVGEVCGSCHLLFQSKVFQKYHWPDFKIVKVNDPVTNKPMAWRDYMIALATSFSGVSNDLQQGQLDKARQHFKEFSVRFKTLPAGCAACHNTPRTYFVDPSVLAMIDQIGKAVDATPPDAKTIGELMGAVGNESCMKCHFVHIPPQQTKERWEKFEDMLK